MFKSGLLGSAAVVMFLGYGCATPKLARPFVSYETRAEVARRWNEALVPSRLTPVSERGMVVYNIDMRINSAAVKVCQRTFSNPQDCPSLLGKRTLNVISEDNDANAFVGGKFDITVLGGLVSMAGNDDEIAFALAHEYSHALMGHVAKREANSGLGILAGLAAGIAVAAATGSDFATGTDITMSSMGIGEQIGSLSFSKDMELEADYLGMFILDEAGYEMRGGVDFIQRLSGLQRQREANGQKGVLGFIKTHPSDTKRVENLIATERVVSAGKKRPSWKK